MSQTSFVSNAPLARIAALVGTTLAIAPSFAQSPQAAGFPKCFARTYSQRHIDTHPGQKVKSIALRLERGTDENRYAHLLVGLTQAPSSPLTASAFCLLAGDTSSPALNWRCGVACDGGGFNVFRDVDGQMYLRNRGVSLESPCGGSGGSTEPFSLEADEQNTLFRLEEVPCR